MMQELPIDLLDPNPFQVRRIPEDDSLFSVETVGLLRTSLIVRPHEERYQLAFGHRTLHTLRKLGKETVACEVREISDEMMAQMLYHENEDRKPLTDLELGLFYQMVMKELKLSLRGTAKFLVVDTGTVSRRVGIAQVAGQVLGRPNTPLTPKSFSEAVTETKFKEVSKLRNEDKKVKALSQIAEHSLSTEETKDLVLKMTEGKTAASAANEVVLEKESRKPQRYSQKKRGLGRVKCLICRRTFLLHHSQHGKHSIQPEVP